MLCVKVAGTIQGAACQLTFIKQAVKQQITGLYGFITSATQDRSPGLRGEGVCAGSGGAEEMLAGPDLSRGNLLFISCHSQNKDIKTLVPFYLVLKKYPII